VLKRGSVLGCKVTIKDTEVTGMVYKNIDVDKAKYVFGSFGGRSMLVRRDLLASVEGNLDDLPKELW